MYSALVPGRRAELNRKAKKRSIFGRDGDTTKTEFIYSKDSGVEIQNFELA